MNTHGIQEVLETFARELEDAGFRVYRPGGHWKFIGFAQQIDGKWCSGTVQADEFPTLSPEGWKWHMNIVPSTANGSSMFLESVYDGSPLTVETARQVAQPTGWNRVVQSQSNGGWPKHWGSR